MAYNLKPRTREENFLGLIAGNENAVEMEPVTRKEKILANMAGGEYEVKARTRKEAFLCDVAENGGGGVQPSGTIEITENGVYDVTEYAGAEVAVPASAVVSGKKTITANGDNIDVTDFASAAVSVPASAVDSGAKTITENGTGIDVVGYAAVDVAVPNPSTGTKSITENGTYDVTDFASATVNVSSAAVGDVKIINDTSGQLTVWGYLNGKWTSNTIYRGQNKIVYYPTSPWNGDAPDMRRFRGVYGLITRDEWTENTVVTLTCPQKRIGETIVAISYTAKQRIMHIDMSAGAIEETLEITISDDL